MGGYVAGDGANRKEVNSANVGMIPNGAIIERDTAVDLKDSRQCRCCCGIRILRPQRRSRKR